MADLQDILYKVNIRSIQGHAVADVKDLQIDSRLVTSGSCFIAIPGSHVDGHDHIDAAITNGATVIVCEKIDLTDSVVQYVVVENSALAAGYMAHNFYGQPSEKFKLVGVTGTNGKTTIAKIHP